MGISRTIAKNTLFNFISTATEIAVSFIVSILLARGLGVEKYGVYAFLMWFMSLAALVVNLGLGEMTRRFVAEAIGKGSQSDARGIVQLPLVIRGSATLVVCFIIIGISSYLATVFNKVHNNSTYFLLVALALIPNVMNDAIGSIFAGFQKYEYGAYLTLGGAPLRLIGIIVLLALGYSVMEIFLMTAILGFLGMFVSILFLRRLVPLRSLVSKSDMDPQVRKDALKYSLTFIGIQVVSYMLWSQAEVLFLGLFTTAEAIGFYNLAFRIPLVTINLVPIVFGRVLLPTVAEQFGKGDMNKVRAIYVTSARYLMMLNFPLVAGGIALASPIIHVLYGMEYQPSVALMRIVFVPFSMMGLIYASTSVIYGIKKPSYILKTGFVVMLVSIGLYLWLIPRYGTLGAAIASSFPRMVVFPIYNYYVYKKIGVPWPFGDSIRAVLASLVMGGAVFGIQTLLGDLPSLIVGIPLGALIYFFTLIFSRFITFQEISILRKAEIRFPSVIRNKYSSFVSRLESFARRT